jgi:hypothetical protein
MNPARSLVCCILVVATLLVSAPVVRAQTTALPHATAPVPPNTNFKGHWVGVLEYRDYQTNQRVFLPTWLTLTPSPDGTSITLSYIYDDGPTKTVRDTSTLTLAPATNKATLADDKTSETYDVAGYPEFTKLGRGVLILTGKGTENNKPVDVRITLTLRRNLYTYQKETRLAGEEFKFRDAYTFTRAEPPAF